VVGGCVWALAQPRLVSGRPVNCRLGLNWATTLAIHPAQPCPTSAAPPLARRYHVHRKEIYAQRARLNRAAPKGCFISCAKYADEAVRIANTGRLAF